MYDKGEIEKLKNESTEISKIVNTIIEEQVNSNIVLLNLFSNSDLRIATTRIPYNSDQIENFYDDGLKVFKRKIIWYSYRLINIWSSLFKWYSYIILLKFWVK